MVYFIGSENKAVVKIGFSNNVNKRLKTIQRFSPFRCKILLVVPGDRKLEGKLHERFGQLNLNNEWFSLSGDLKTFVDMGINNKYKLLDKYGFIGSELEKGSTKWDYLEVEDDNDNPVLCYRMYRLAEVISYRRGGYYKNLSSVCKFDEFCFSVSYMIRKLSVGDTLVGNIKENYPDKTHETFVESLIPPAGVKKIKYLPEFYNGYEFY